MEPENDSEKGRLMSHKKPQPPNLIARILGPVVTHRMRRFFSKSKKAKLKGVGYWKNDECRRYPQPQRLVQPGWHTQDLAKIITYLRSGRDYISYLGYSHCRFSDCRDECRERNGVSDLSDGVWVWPEGLAHYIEKHSVILPEEFISTMRLNDWRIPQQIELPKIETGVSLQDDTFWIKWARKRRPWHIIW
jgi:hypothetical protein